MRHKPTDEELGELYSLLLVSKELNARITFLKDLCKEYGSCCTENYACVVYPQARRGMASLDLCAEAIGLDTLLKYSLINISESLIVKVSKKENL